MKEKIEKSKDQIAHEEETAKPAYSERYLGVMVCPCNWVRTEKKSRDTKAKAARTELAPVLRNPRMPWNIKRRAWQACVGSRAIYGSECWNGGEWDPQKWLRKTEEAAMQYMSKGRAQPGQGWYLGLWKRYTKQKLQWLGHIIRMDPERMVRRLTMERGKQVFSDVVPTAEWDSTIQITERPKWQKYVRATLETIFGPPRDGPIYVEKQTQKYFLIDKHAHAYKVLDKKSRKRYDGSESPPRVYISQSGVSHFSAGRPPI